MHNIIERHKIWLRLIQNSLLIGGHDVFGESTKMSWQVTLARLLLSFSLLLVSLFFRLVLILLYDLLNRWFFSDIRVNILSFQTSKVYNLSIIHFVNL